MTRTLDIALLDATGAPVRWRTNARSRLADLRFSSSLPGGFSDCSFVLEEPAARVASLTANTTVIVYSGATVVWWGYLEDVHTMQHGSVRTVSAHAFGPWQLFQQRLIDESYTAVDSGHILRDIITAYVPELSVDFSQITDTAMPLTVTYENAQAAAAVKTIVDAGLTSKELLFAIWQPAGSATKLGNTGNLLADSGLELGLTHWYFTPGKSGNDFSSAQAHSGLLSARFVYDAEDSIAIDAKIAVAELTTYIVDFWHYWSVHSGMTVTGVVEWYTAGDVYISTDYLTVHTSSGADSSWTQRVEEITSPATAGLARVRVLVDPNGSSREIFVDDIRVYRKTSDLAADTKPRAYLWTRDLSTYDYVLRTHDVDGGLATTQTTRDVANRVLASYGTGYFTDAVTDTDSQAAYRQRDFVMAAGSVSEADAEAMRDTYLERHSTPGTEVESFRLMRAGAVRTATGQVVRPELLRAGDRLLIADGQLAGTIILLSQVEYADGVVSCQPESYEDASRLLAHV